MTNKKKTNRQAFNQIVSNGRMLRWLVKLTCW